MKEVVAEDKKQFDETFFFEGPKDYKLFGRVWKTSDMNPKGTLVGVHGYSEHSHCYAHFSHYLNQSGFNVIWMDLPGHGHSSGRRSDVSDFDDYVQSAELLMKEAELVNCAKPFHLFGHSLGGMVALRFIQSSPLSGQIKSLLLSSPLIGVHDFRGWRQYPYRLLSMILPNLTIPNSETLGEESLTHDVKMREERNADSLIEPKVTVNWVRSYFRAKRKLYRDINKIQLPVSLFQAGDDKVTDRNEAEYFFSLLPSLQKDCKIYEGFYHEILNEIGREQVMKDMLEWINKVAD